MAQDDDDPVLVEIDELSQSMRILVDLWYKVLTDTELLVQALLRRLEERQGRNGATGSTAAAATGTTTGASSTHTRTVTRTQQQQTANLSSPRPSPATETARRRSTSSVSSHSSMRGIENLQQLLDEDAASNGSRSSSRRTTRTTHRVSDPDRRSAGSASTSRPHSPRSGTRTGTGRTVTTETRTSSRQAEESVGSVGSGGSVRTRRRDIKAKTVVRENIAKLEEAVRRLNEVKSRMCTQMVSGTKGNAAYDSAAIELDETVRKLQSVGLTT